MLEDWIEERIRRAPPSACCVVAGSTPVVSFGNARTARVATLGLNPSRIEFIEDGVELVGERRRLASLNSLGVRSLVDASREQVATVLHECERYFERRPYRQWFDQLEGVLAAIGASYYGDRPTACHLDIVQWATDPTWGALDRHARAKLVAADGPFLMEQLRHSSIKLLLVNGAGPLHKLGRLAGVEFEPQGRRLAMGSIVSELVSGTIGTVRVIGWRANLQSSHGVANVERRALGEAVLAVVGRC